jgi:hypothetical protein
VKVTGWAAAEAIIATRDDRIIKEVLNIYGSKRNWGIRGVACRGGA